ncbi:hypothetical protein SARC_08593 [Sphaeroforma arctica JP610]|uniref:C2H2-type domain-containing protein n=1 Tax=Sphaeroforma arctica JP610 TaxID=667725 RepID=A0A0L0FQD6_9EUKA|nr:hypothetical protein SARC_08593 [Sphaeroforma arctica JP610]KNC78992.1 hypothetical protein SARC_08593 [Sphaeroforma arctica JP610]|eukprot:XP_014152894.1 hypothetical protein SARC_08593 [Sphaeroforma arctica JP610]
MEGYQKGGYEPIAYHGSAISSLQGMDGDKKNGHGQGQGQGSYNPGDGGGDCQQQRRHQAPPHYQQYPNQLDREHYNNDSYDSQQKYATRESQHYNSRSVNVDQQQGHSRDIVHNDRNNDANMNYYRSQSRDYGNQSNGHHPPAYYSQSAPTAFSARRDNNQHVSPHHTTHPDQQYRNPQNDGGVYYRRSEPVITEAMRPKNMVQQMTSANMQAGHGSTGLTPVLGTVSLNFNRNDRNQPYPSHMRNQQQHHGGVWGGDGGGGQMSRPGMRGDMNNNNKSNNTNSMQVGAKKTSKSTRVRRRRADLERSFPCGHEGCSRLYASNHARHLHYRLKHDNEAPLSVVNAQQAAEDNKSSGDKNTPAYNPVSDVRSFSPGVPYGQQGAQAKHYPDSAPAEQSRSMWHQPVSAKLGASDEPRAQSLGSSHSAQDQRNDNYMSQGQAQGAHQQVMRVSSEQYNQSSIRRGSDQCGSSMGRPVQPASLAQRGGSFKGIPRVLNSRGEDSTENGSSLPGSKGLQSKSSEFSSSYSRVQCSGRQTPFGPREREGLSGNGASYLGAPPSWDNHGSGTNSDQNQPNGEGNTESHHSQDPTSHRDTVETKRLSDEGRSYSGVYSGTTHAITREHPYKFVTTASTGIANRENGSVDSSPGRLRLRHHNHSFTDMKSAMSPQNLNALPVIDKSPHARSPSSPNIHSAYPRSISHGKLSSNQSDHSDRSGTEISTTTAGERAGVTSPVRGDLRVTQSEMGGSAQGRSLAIHPLSNSHDSIGRMSSNSAGNSSFGEYQATRTNARPFDVTNLLA